MNISNNFFSPGFGLNEQIARQIFEIMPEQGPIMVILDKSGSCWPSNSEEYAKLQLNASFLKELCAKVDDGVEPVISQREDCSIVASQLSTDKTNCGYILLALPHYTPESTFLNADLIEMVLGQICLAAKLIEKNTLLYDLWQKGHSTITPFQPKVPALN
jgi:hypothetical protein